MEERITGKLRDAFQPSLLEVVDDSEAHRGHGGWREGGGTHFNVKIRAAAFEGLNRVAAQREVMQALQAEFDDGLHALSLDVSA